MKCLTDFQAVGADDFEARSPDELSLSKNDRIELLERDDEFGDGWYLGRHLKNNQTGLFPEGMRSHDISPQFHSDPTTVTQNVGCLYAHVGDSSQQRTEIAQQTTVRRLPSLTNISSHLRQSAFIRDDIFSQHRPEMDRKGVGNTLVFPLPPSNIPSQVRQKAALFCEQENITAHQYREVNSQSARDDNQFSSPTIDSPEISLRECLSHKWEISSRLQEEIDRQNTRNSLDISTTFPLSPGAVLSHERDEISNRVHAELVRRIAASNEAFLRSSVSLENQTSALPRALDKISSRVQAEIDRRIAAGAGAPPQSDISRKQAAVQSSALREVSSFAPAELYRRAAASTGAILQPSRPLPDKTTVRSKSLEDVFKYQQDKTKQFDAPTLCPLPLFSTSPRAKHNNILPRGVEETPSRQQKSIKRAAVRSVAPGIAPSAGLVHPHSPCLSIKSESTEVSNHFGLEDYLACALVGIVYTTNAPQDITTTSTASAPEPTSPADVQTTAVAAISPAIVEQPRAASPTLPAEFFPQISQTDQNTNQFGVSASTPSPLNSPGTTTSMPSTALRNIGIATGNQHTHGEDSPVMSETLSVIDEHITDMSTPRHSIAAANRRGANDSGSEYSSLAERQMSYITGEQTDEEEQCTYSEAQVLQWSPTDVAAYLHSVGVENYHCQIFQEQEISGEVLLGMSQTDLFIEAFDLGLLGRRLRTWHKIRALQDEVKGSRSTSRTADSYYGADSVGLEDTGRGRGSAIGAVLPRIPSLMERPGSRQQHDRLSARQTNQPQPTPGYSMSPSAFNPLSSQDNPTRPPAASPRDSDHRRRHSSIDARTVPLTNEKSAEGTKTTNHPTTPHKKDRSFDRSWTMGELAPTKNGRPSTSMSGRESISGHKLSISFDRNRFDGRPRDSGYTTLSPKDLDRGYFSGGELDNVKARATLKKRESGSHSRKSSYTDEQRIRAGTAHSRYSSAGSIRELGFASITLPTASQIYHGKSMNDRLRGTGKSNTFMPTRALKDPTSPTVTKLENGAAFGLIPPGPDTDASSSGRASPMPMSGETKLVGSSKSTRAASGLRAISDAVTGSEKARLESPVLKTGAITESPVRSPTGTGSSTPSGSKSFDSDPCEGRKPVNGTIRTRTSSGTTRRKSKKETSAYREGLEEKTPQEAIKDCDYSGWMKKKSSKLIAAWNPRLFVLKGTRLAYYYSENDQREKGVIDIAFHRVLTAENDRITGLHATLTGATASPTSPQGALTPTSASTDAAAGLELTPKRVGNDSVFIFKLVPPRPGLSKAVTFTMPKVHYFAVDNIKQGRLWMAALMKATIDRDETSPITSTYQLKTISLSKAVATRQRPPALMGPDEKVDEEPSTIDTGDEGLNIRGIIFDGDADEEDSEIGVSKAREGIRKVSSFDGKPDVNT
ncbi:hypothetical protein FGG08_003452 [Glutinoglossum americanum]|uniref:Uncharacterized protein n=1 Tax=Glutinoglossum americanum TaxID=1670608 RepID=A0A9P8I2Q1_9PEZI|nr:hypothetical protein FGG08_003452 [Glutinoglossum americanum]